MKAIIKEFLKYITILVGGILVGTIALTLVYMLPTELMEIRVRSSMEVFYTESVYPQQVPGYKTTQLDNETDAIMLLGAIYNGSEEPAVKRAMRVERINFTETHACCNELIQYAWENQIPDSTEEYSRYWHGYMVWLKPLLLLLDYADIRMINMALQIFLLLVLISEMTQKGLKCYILPLGMALFVLNPVASAMSMQFSSIYYIVLISMVLMLKKHERWQQKNRYPYIFFLLGMLTVYFDFLTYPTAAFCMPLTLYILLEQKNWKEQIKDIFSLGICFSLGYGGMWIGKWVIGSLILQENVFAMAIRQLTLHTGNSVVDGEVLSRAGVVFRNLKVLMKWPYVLVFLLGVIGCMYKASITSLKKRCLSVMPFVIIAVIPFIWIYLTSSHATWCYWYTYRGFMVSAFAGFSALVILAGKNSHGRNFD